MADQVCATLPPVPPFLNETPAADKKTNPLASARRQLVLRLRTPESTLNK
jgi:hypothetical protein